MSYFTECTPQQAKTATNGVVTIADDVCRELEQQPEPDWVLLACDLVDATGKVVTTSVRIPRAQWTAIRAKGADLVFPGK